MSKQRKTARRDERTAGKTAKEQSAMQNTARIERWRHHAKNKLAQLKDKPRLLQELRLVAKFENKSPLEVVIDKLLRERGNARIVFDIKSKCFSMPLYHACIDTDYEHSYSHRMRNAHEKEVVNMAVYMSLDQIPNSIPLREKRNLERFYRKGDYSLYNASIRAMRYALSGKEVA